MRLVLASASPRRKALLESAGFEFDVAAVDVDEDLLPDEAPEAYVERLAVTKAEAGALANPGRPSLGADTVVVVDGELLGKPVDDDEARSMLRRLSGRSHVVLTGVAIAHAGRTHSRVESTTVWVSTLSGASIDWYVQSGEPADKAGAYGIQGRASRFIPRIDGSYTSVVGLPMAVVLQLCEAAGLSVDSGPSGPYSG